MPTRGMSYTTNKMFNEEYGLWMSCKLESPLLEARLILEETNLYKSTDCLIQ
jgi:hypothetical protein